MSERIYQVAIFSQHTSRAGRCDRSFDFEDEDENRDDYQIFEGTRAELLDTARGYHGQDRYHDRLAESLCEAIGADLNELSPSPERGKTPSKSEIADQFVRCTDKIAEIQKSGVVIPKLTFAEHVRDRFRLSFGTFFFWGPKTLEQLDLTYVELVGTGIVQSLTKDLGQPAAEVLHLSQLLRVPLSPAFVEFQSLHQ